MPTARTRPSELSADRQSDATEGAAPALRSLVRLSLLERVSPELLVRFLRPFQGYLAARGVELNGVGNRPSCHG
jgi:hypothetical protein